MIYAAGNTNAKIDTVKQMYKYHLTTEDMQKTLTHFGDAGLKQALKKVDQYSARHEGEEGCLDHDALTQSQDPAAALNGKVPQLSLLPSGKVMAHLRHAKITYALSCVGNKCKI